MASGRAQLVDGEVYYSWSSCVQAARLAIGITPEEAAKRAGLTRYLWCRMERLYGTALLGEPKNQPSFNTIRKVCLALCVDIQVHFPSAAAELISYSVRFTPEAITIRGKR